MLYFTVSKFIPHLPPVNLQEFCSSCNFVFLVFSSVENRVVVAFLYILGKCLLLKDLKTFIIMSPGAEKESKLFFKLHKQYFNSCTPRENIFALQRLQLQFIKS